MEIKVGGKGVHTIRSMIKSLQELVRNEKRL